MAVYVFNLLVGFKISGVDHAQGYRASILKDFPIPVKFIFTRVPEYEDICHYRDLGISVEQMLSMHQYFLGNHTLEATENAYDKAAELKARLHCNDVSYRDEEIWLFKDGYVVASILLDKADPKNFYKILYFCQTKLVRAEFYTKGITYANYYVTAASDNGPHAKLVRRTFYDTNGSVVYEQIWKGDDERYIFPDGRIYTRTQFGVEFIKRLNLSEKDIVFLDRGENGSALQPLFQHSEKARIMTFFHSGHFFEKWEDPRHFLYLNYEYLYWFKCSNRIDTMVVSTQRQKEELIAKLEEYKCSVPNVEVIPVAGLDRLRHPEKGRKRYSLITVSRLNSRKRIDWIIKSVVKAHEKNSNIFIDIYGEQEYGYYFQYLQDLVSESDAQSYVRFRGYKDVTEVYKEYEVYISASLWETFGLSLMEATGSGTAMIGLDVKYGNQLFIQPAKNGYLIDFDPKYTDGDDSKLIDDMAEKIVEIFADEERLERFHRASYEIAKGFSTRSIEKKWKDLLR